MSDAKAVQIRPRKYSCSFTTESDAAVAHVLVTAARFGVQLDVRAEEPSDFPDHRESSPSSRSEDFSGDGVRLDSF